jgi:hypothetical protein
VTSSALRRDRTFLYWRQTPTWCPDCGARVPGRIISEGPRVYLERACPSHGHGRGLLHESLEAYLARALQPARRSAVARPPAPAECPRNCTTPCAWHEGPVRRLQFAATGSPGALESVAREALVARLRANGEPLADVVYGETAAHEAFLRVGRAAPDDGTLAAWFAGVAAGSSTRRAWLESADGLPLDVLGRRIARAAGLPETAWTPDPDSPLCLSRARTATGLDIVLHAPMHAATLDLTRLLSCSVWVTSSTDRVVPACWAAIREET